MAEWLVTVLADEYSRDNRESRGEGFSQRRGQFDQRQGFWFQASQ
ncbi:MAG: hypothetical protein OER87_00615 [Gammaproteobacteria bacterium]|nr:hypothetical protein [Gammaproteobacteria bacterium]